MALSGLEDVKRPINVFLFEDFPPLLFVPSLLCRIFPSLLFLTSVLCPCLRLLEEAKLSVLSVKVSEEPPSGVLLLLLREKSLFLRDGRLSNDPCSSAESVTSAGNDFDFFKDLTSVFSSADVLRTCTVVVPTCVAGESDCVGGVLGLLARLRSLLPRRKVETLRVSRRLFRNGLEYGGYEEGDMIDMLMVGLK